MATLFEFVATTVSVVGCPAITEAGLALIVIVGFWGSTGGTGTKPTHPLRKPVIKPNKREKSNRREVRRRGLYMPVFGAETQVESCLQGSLFLAKKLSLRGLSLFCRPNP